MNNSSSSQAILVSVTGLDSGLDISIEINKYLE